MQNMLFRAKRKDSGLWTFGDIILNSSEIKQMLVINTGNLFVDVIPDSLGQYINKEDFDGHYIFQGDLLEFDGYLGEDYFIEIAKSKTPPHNFIQIYRKKPNSSARGISNGISNILEELPNDCRIVGNIYDGLFSKE